jgi:D-3-phosphoglycerate dehydrogenase
MQIKTIIVTTSTFAQFDGAPLEKLNVAGFKVILNPHGRKLTEVEVDSLFKEYKPVGIIAGVEPLTKNVLENSAAYLLVISRAGVGLDNVDIKAAADLGIKVFSTPDAPTTAVAELAIGLILSVLRKIPQSDAAIRSGKWKPVMGSLLEGKTVGVVGVGRIGGKLANILQKGFGAIVIGYDPFIQTSDPPKAPCLLTTTLEELLSKSDIVSLHISKPSGSSYYIGAKEIAMMKNGAVIINTSRGGLVDESALKTALDKKRLAGAGLDVFEDEPYNGTLIGNENVVLTMHMGSYAKESRTRMEMEAVQNLLSGLHNIRE